MDEAVGDGGGSSAVVERVPQSLKGKLVVTMVEERW